jgi:antitoxin component of MazEF toxin-antitoxin module
MSEDDSKLKTVWQLVWANRVRNVDKMGRLQSKNSPARSDEKKAMEDYKYATENGFPAKVVKKVLKELETTDGRKVYLGISNEDVRVNPKWKRIKWNERAARLKRLIKEYEDKLLQAKGDLEEHRRNKP